MHSSASLTLRSLVGNSAATLRTLRADPLRPPKERVTARMVATHDHPSAQDSPRKRDAQQIRTHASGGYK